MPSPGDEPTASPSAKQSDASFQVRTVSAISEISAPTWDGLAQPDPATANPFVSHAFLSALERAECVGPRKTGWLPRHLVLEEAGGAIVGAAPMYAKTHSQGEYVFDHGWADALERAGGQYYPKLQIAVPFTPVPGPRFLVGAGPEAPARLKALAQGARAVAEAMEVSSLHATFVDEPTWQTLGQKNGGYLQRIDQQYHWRNRGYGSFADFLGALSSRKRKTIRKERETALSSGLTVEHVQGRDITEAHWDAFFQFYMDTGSRKWGRPYLNRNFFSELGATMGDHCLLIFAKRGDAPIAGALNLIGGDCLYGRYWGAIEQHPCLHFEICYYQAMDFAIAHKLARVEAGAQGDHKLTRGYEPTTTHSLHWVQDTGFHQAVARFLKAERAHVVERQTLLAEYGPFRKTISDAEA